MNEYQLNRLLRLCPQFGGVFSADNIQIGETPSFIVVNTDRVGLGGTHWVVMYLNETQSEFFDSLGQAPTCYHKEWATLLAETSPQYAYNDVRLQDSMSQTCGHFCIYYILKRHHGNSFNDIIERFDDNLLQKNDRFVLKFVNTLSERLGIN